jgi:hypothetical protein
MLIVTYLENSPVGTFNYERKLMGHIFRWLVGPPNGKDGYTHTMSVYRKFLT